MDTYLALGFQREYPFFNHVMIPPSPLLLPYRNTIKLHIPLSFSHKNSHQTQANFE